MTCGSVPIKHKLNKKIGFERLSLKRLIVDESEM
jgi:hypothetical protein